MIGAEQSLCRGEHTAPTGRSGGDCGNRRPRRRLAKLRVWVGASLRTPCTLRVTAGRGPRSYDSPTKTYVFKKGVKHSLIASMRATPRLGAVGEWLPSLSSKKELGLFSASTRDACFSCEEGDGGATKAMACISAEQETGSASEFESPKPEGA